MSGPSAELHVSALREPLLGATSDRMSEKPRLDVVIGKERSRIWLPRDLWAEVEPGNGDLDVTVRNGDRLYVVSKGVFRSYSPGRLGEEAGEVSNTLHGAHRGDRSQRAFTESCQAGFRFRRSPVPSQPAQLWSQRRHLVRKSYLHDKDDRQRGRIEILALRHDFV